MYIHTHTQSIERQTYCRLYVRIFHAPCLFGVLQVSHDACNLPALLFLAKMKDNINFAVYRPYSLMAANSLFFCPCAN